MSGIVVTIKIGNKEIKSEVIRNKNKLREEKIFFKWFKFWGKKVADSDKWVKAQENKGKGV